MVNYCYNRLCMEKLHHIRYYVKGERRQREEEDDEIVTDNTSLQMEALLM